MDLELGIIARQAAMHLVVALEAVVVAVAMVETVDLAALRVCF